MTQTISRFEEVVTRFRHMLPTGSDTTQVRDRQEPWERIALNAIARGYFKSADEFVRFIDACLRTLAFEQIMHDRAHAIGIRNLAEAIARQWACGRTPTGAPTTDEIAGLLQSDWVASGQFRSLRSAGYRSGAET